MPMTSLFDYIFMLLLTYFYYSSTKIMIFFKVYEYFAICEILSTHHEYEKLSPTKVYLLEQ